jgi:hypothetical protein
MRSKKNSNAQLRQLVQRLLRSTKPGVDTPVIVSTAEGDHQSAVGRLLERSGARVSAQVDVALERERAVTVFLPENAYLGEVVSCVPQGKRYTVELMLIQYREN